mgnify:CR=1 FL=1
MIEVHLIWAQDDNGGIGINGKLPWHISSDLKNFKKITLNSTIIMGRKTIAKEGREVQVLVSLLTLRPSEPHIDVQTDLVATVERGNFVNTPQYS